MSTTITPLVSTLLGTGNPVQTNQNAQNPNSATSLIGNVTSSAGSAASSAASSAVSALSGLFDLTSSRIIAIILGLICIVGAILLYLGEDIAGAVGLAGSPSEAGGKLLKKVGSISVT